MKKRVVAHRENQRTQAFCAYATFTHEAPGDVNLKSFKCPDSFDLAPTISTMGSSKQLSRKLKLKIVDAHKAGEGYKKRAKRFQMPISSVRNVIKKWQSSGIVEVKARSGRKNIRQNSSQDCEKSKSKPTFDCTIPPERSGRHWSFGTLFHYKEILVQISSWKSHQKETSSTSSPQKSTF